MLDALMRLVVRRPRRILAATLVFVLGAALTGADLAERLRAGQGTEDPASESAAAARLLEEHFPQASPNLILLVSSAHGVDDRRTARAALEIAESIAYENGVSGTVSYWQTGSGELKSRDGRHAVIAVRLSGSEAEASVVAARLAERYGGEHGPLRIRLGGQTAVLQDIEATIAEDLLRAELLALPLTLLILLWVFGSVASAVLPLAIGVICIVATNAVLRVIAGATDVSVFAQNLTIGLGLGLSIDYALLMVRRFRAELASGLAPAEAAAATVRTAGRTVLFSALAISLCLMSMLAFPLYFLRSFAYAGVSVVFFAALASLVLLPAAFVLLGPRVDALRPGRLLPPGLRRRVSEEAGERRWTRLARSVMSRPIVFASLSAGLLLLVGTPFLRVEFGMADDRQLPSEAESRQVMDVLRGEFDVAAAGTIDVVARAGE